MHDKDDIIHMATSIIRDEIRTKVYDFANYPDLCSQEDFSADIPNGLSRLLHGIIESNAENQVPTERRQLPAQSYKHIDPGHLFLPNYCQ